MDKTNYTVLSIVAIVAIIAVVSIFLDGRASAGLPSFGETITANAVLEIPRSGGLTGGITGNVVAESPKTIAAPKGDPYDLNDNGKLDAADAEILGLVIDRVQFCPRGKTCDIDGNGKVTVQDLSLLNSQLLKQEVANTITQPVDDRSYAIATTGGVA